VTFTGINATIQPAAVATDAAGRRAWCDVGPASRIGDRHRVRSVSSRSRWRFNVAGGPATQLVVMCGPSRPGRTLRDAVTDERVAGVTDVIGEAGQTEI